jgi:hypothetical protein
MDIRIPQWLSGIFKFSNKKKRSIERFFVYYQSGALSGKAKPTLSGDQLSFLYLSAKKIALLNRCVQIIFLLC